MSRQNVKRTKKPRAILVRSRPLSPLPDDVVNTDGPTHDKNPDQS